MAALTLLSIQCKKSDAVDLRSPIYGYIAHTYSDRQARDAEEDLAGVQEERNEISGLTGSLTTLAATLQKTWLLPYGCALPVLLYYAGLSMMETRFPISKDRSHVHVSFKWYDAFRPTRALEQYSIHFEKAAILFNLGAILSQQALSCDMKSDVGVKEAAKKFQEAAGAFVQLREGPSLKVEQPRPIDISPECAAMLEKLCLAQAQECTFEKARLDKKNPAILARLAKQVAIYYGEIRSMLSQPPLNQHFDKSWLCHTGVKATLYEAEVQNQAAMALHAEQEIGSETARIKEAQRILESAKKDLKSASPELNESFKALNKTLGAALLQADRENKTVYLQRVPALSDLPQILPASLVKPIQPQLDRSRDGLFSSVVPDGSAKALSKYTEMVDSLIREQMDALAQASDEARLKLREWELPECIMALDKGSSAALPDGVKGELERLEENGGVRHLSELAQQIKELRKVTEDELRSVEEDIRREVNEDAEQRQKYQQRWNRPASVALNSQITEKIAGYRANLTAAGDSDQRLQRQLQESASSLSSLSMDGAVNQMPRLQAPMVSTGEVEPAQVVTRLRQALTSIDELSAERASLEEALKIEKNRDNILPRIMSISGNYDALFREEIAKYDKLKAEVAENVTKQAQIMEVIAQSQFAYKQIFGYNEWRAACQAASSGMRGRLTAYRELQDQFGEGLRFYMSLQEAISTLKQQAGDYILTRTIQKDDMLEDFRRGNDDEQRRQRQAADQAVRDKAQASLTQMSMNSHGNDWPQQPQNYPPAPSWMQGNQGQQGTSSAPPPPPTSSSQQYPAQQYPPPASHNQNPYGASSTPPPPPPNQATSNTAQQNSSGAPSWPPNQSSPGASAPSWGSQIQGQYQPQAQFPPPQQYYQHPQYYQAPQQQPYNNQPYSNSYQQGPAPPQYNPYGRPPQGNQGQGQGPSW